MKRLISALVLPMILSACATDPLVERCYQDVQTGDFPLGKRVSVDFGPSGVHEKNGREWAILPVKDHQGNADWLICIYDKDTGKLLSTNTTNVTSRQVICESHCGTQRWDF